MVKKKRRQRPQVTDAEFEILECLWALGQATRKQIMQQVYPRQSESDRATVQKLLERLEAKDLVTRNRSCRPQLFRPTVDREELVGSQLQAVAQRLCGGSLAPLLCHLVQQAELTDDDYDALRELIDRRDAKRRNKANRR